MGNLTISDIQQEARQSFDIESLSQTIMRMKERFAEIRQEIITLLEGEDVQLADAETMVKRMSIERIQSQAQVLIETGQLTEALVYMRKQLSNYRKRCARVLCSPFQMRDTIEEFIEHLGEEGHEVPVSCRHVGLEEL